VLVAPTVAPPTPAKSTVAIAVTRASLRIRRSFRRAIGRHCNGWVLDDTWNPIANAAPPEMGGGGYGSRVDLSVRLVEPGDAAALLAIYNPEVLESTVTFDLVPRTIDEQRDWIDEHRGGHPAVVAVDAQSAVVGYASLSPYRPRAAYNSTVEDSVYVHRDHQGRGVGRRLLDELLVVGRASGFHAVIARIVGGHEASIALHARCGFELVGVEREVGRKFGKWLDVVEMQLIL